MEILISNDDGWGAKGIVTLARLMSTLGHVTVVAPDGARSGRSTAITVAKPMYLRKVETAATNLPDNVDVYTTNGNPADCIKLAINAIYDGDESRIDVLVSGINHGHNASVNLIYSGTMGACLVAAEHNIPAIGFSINDHTDHPDFSYLEPYIPELTRHLIDGGFPKGTCYNINAPTGPIAGIRWTRQCAAHWEKELEPHVDEHGETYYILVGNFVNHEPEAQDTDIWAIEHGYLSIQPVQLDMTNYNAM